MGKVKYYLLLRKDSIFKWYACEIHEDYETIKIIRNNKKALLGEDSKFKILKRELTIK